MRFCIWLICPLLIIVVHIYPQAKDTTRHPSPKVLKLDDAGKGYLRLLGGPPETSTMRSGLVALAPTKSVGKHSTENYEEIVVVLKGEGEMPITGGDTLHFKEGEVIYCPSQTEHDVTNTGSGELRYLYVVAKAAQRKEIK